MPRSHHCRHLGLSGVTVAYAGTHAQPQVCNYCLWHHSTSSEDTAHKQSFPNTRYQEYRHGSSWEAVSSTWLARGKPGGGKNCGKGTGLGMQALGMATDEPLSLWGQYGDGRGSWGWLARTSGFMRHIPSHELTYASPQYKRLLPPPLDRCRNRGYKAGKRQDQDLNRRFWLQAIHHHSHNTEWSLSSRITPTN
jgi:hypothetical protein